LLLYPPLPLSPPSFNYHKQLLVERKLMVLLEPLLPLLLANLLLRVLPLRLLQ
jgi:hypothetical protein